MAKNVLEFLISAKDEASSVLEKIGGALAGLAGKILDAAKSAVNFEFPTLKASTDDAERLEKQMGALRAAIDATGGAAGLTAEDIDALARNLDEATLGSAEGFRNAALQLLTFKSVGVDAFERTLKAAQDLSAAGFGTVESATVQLGKALEDPVKGLTALTRVGVTFTEEQKKMIESFVRLGDVAGAQNVILAAVEGQVKGVAAAAGSGLAGAVDLVGKRMTDLRETIGGVLLPILTTLNLVWADVIGAVNEAAARLAGPLKAASEQAGQALKALGEGVAAFLSDALQRLGDWISNLDWASIQQGAENAKTKIAELWDRFVDLGQAVQTFSDVVKVAFNGVQIAFNTVLTGVQGLVAGFLEGLAFIEQQAAKVGLGTLERSNELKAEAERWKTLAAESAAAIARDAGQAGEALDRLSGRTDAAAEGQKKLADAAKDTAVELGVINKTLEDYQALADRANAATAQAKRDLDAGKISAEEYGRVLLEAADAAQDLADAQDAETFREATVAVKDQTAALVAQISQLETAAEENAKLSKAADEVIVAQRKQLQAELELAKARGDTVAVMRLTAQLAQEEIEDAKALADAKRNDADILREIIKKREGLLEAQGGNNAEAEKELDLLRQKLAVADAEAGAADATAQALAKKKTATDQSKVSTEGATEATQKNTEAQEKGNQATKDGASLAQEMANALNAAKQRTEALSAATGVLFEKLLWKQVQKEVTAYTTETAKYLTQLDATPPKYADITQKIAEMNAAIAESKTQYLLAANSVGRFLASVQQAEATSTKAFFEQKLQVEQLADRYEQLAETGRGSFASIEAALFGLNRTQTITIDSMDLLGEQDLARLRKSIDDARTKLVALKNEADSARDAIAKLNAEIAAEKGDDATARKLQLELEQRQALAEVERALESARAAGNRELIRLYEDQRGKLNELYRLKERNLEADLRGEESGRRTKNTLSELADEAERANRALGGLGGVNLGNLQNQADRLKTSFTDLNAVL